MEAGCRRERGKNFQVKDVRLAGKRLDPVDDRRDGALQPVDLVAHRAGGVDQEQQIEGDTILPPFDPAKWVEIARETHQAEGGRPAFSFVTLARRP